MKEIFVQVFKVADEFVILKGTKAAEPKFREPLSELIIAQYGRGAYKTAVVTEILFFCQNYYISEFERICNNENSYTFYKEIVWLHEQATNLRQSEHFDNLPQGISKSYIAEYRRILKMIIEQGCCVNMISSEKRDSEFQKRIDSIINDLLFLGSMLILCAECIAEQTMIKDDIDILEEHFKLRFNEPTLSLKEYEIEGIFFINTPTFYMYNSDLRIYTFEQVIDVITGKHIDPIFSYYVNKEDSNIFYSIKYPYFRKPTMFYYEDKDEDCEVDKYGFPIKN